MAWSTIATVAPMALQLGGGIAKGFGQMKGGQSSSAQMQYQAAVARNNAAALRMMADRTVQGGLVNADITSLRGAAKVGAVKAKQGASGINVNKGSAVDVRAGLAQSNKFDAETVLRNADLTAWGYRVKADQEEQQANLYSMGAGGAAAGGTRAGIGTLLETATALPWNWIGSGGSGYDLSADTARTAGDADLGGYGGNPA